jgi:hypothetical protein
MLNSEEMEQGAAGGDAAVQSALFFETPAEICLRVFRELRPRTPAPQVRVDFCRYANINSTVRLQGGALHLRISDLLEGAPAPVLEALIYLLLAKLLRKSAPKMYAHRYRLYINRKDVRRQMHLVRQVRGRKFVSGPRGRHHDLSEIFERLNAAYFDGLLGQPQLGWTRRPSRSLLGHFDPSHNAIIISSLFDRPEEEALALEYVLFHEMLHLRYPVDHAGARRRVHTREFRAAEKTLPRLKEAKELLKRL